MSKIRPIRIRLPHTLSEVSAIDGRGVKLFTVPKIVVFTSKVTADILGYGIRNVTDTITVETKVRGYIASIYGDQAYELDRCVQQILNDNKEINIVGYLNNRMQGQLIGVSIEASSFIDDEKGPHTGWIKVIADDYTLSRIKDKIKFKLG